MEFCILLFQIGHKGRGQVFNSLSEEIWARNISGALWKFRLCVSSCCWALVHGLQGGPSAGSSGSCVQKQARRLN